MDSVDCLVSLANLGTADFLEHQDFLDSQAQAVTQVSQGRVAIQDSAELRVTQDLVGRVVFLVTQV